MQVRFSPLKNIVDAGEGGDKAHNPRDKRKDHKEAGGHVADWEENGEKPSWDWQSRCQFASLFGAMVDSPGGDYHDDEVENQIEH